MGGIRGGAPKRPPFSEYSHGPTSCYMCGIFHQTDTNAVFATPQMQRLDVVHGRQLRCLPFRRLHQLCTRGLEYVNEHTFVFTCDFSMRAGKCLYAWGAENLLCNFEIVNCERIWRLSMPCAHFSRLVDGWCDVILAVILTEERSWKEISLSENLDVIPKIIIVKGWDSANTQGRWV